MRHPESEQNASGVKMFDSGDPDLSTLGHRQGHAAGRQVQRMVQRGLRLDAIIVSPAKRALLGGLIVQRWVPDIPLEVDSRLKEINWGDWAGKLQKDIMTKAVQKQADDEGLAFCPPNGESMLSAYQDFQEVRDEYAGYNTLMVSHGFKIKSLVAGRLAVAGQVPADMQVRQAARKLSVENAELLQFQPVPGIVYTDLEQAVDRIYNSAAVAA